MTENIYENSSEKRNVKPKVFHNNSSQPLSVLKLAPSVSDHFENSCIPNQKFTKINTPKLIEPQISLSLLKVVPKQKKHVVTYLKQPDLGEPGFIIWTDDEVLYYDLICFQSHCDNVTVSDKNSQRINIRKSDNK